jgi:beta-phosphoglucomutase-like phosphatase (HAD superfamily)
MPIKAVVFDMDGVLSDTQTLRRALTARWRAEVEDQALFGIVQGGTPADRLISDLKDLPLSLFAG